jgi:hypothetical protein
MDSWRRRGAASQPCRPASNRLTDNPAFINVYADGSWTRFYSRSGAASARRWLRQHAPDLATSMFMIVIRRKAVPE